jgi:hypothetical protein
MIAGIRGHGKPLIESNTYSIISLPNDMAWKPQSFIWYDQCERRCNRSKIAVRKLERRTRRGEVAHEAWVFVAAILGDCWLIHSMARGNPSVDHAEVRSLHCLSIWRLVVTFCDK